MNIFDIIALIVFLVSIVICLWRGFLKTVLKLGAPVLAAICARFLGRPLGGILLPKLIQKPPSSMSADTLERLNGTISSVVGTIIVFVVLFIAFRLLAGLLAKTVKKITGTSVLDRVLGAVFGLLIGFAAVVLLAETLEIVAMIGTFVYPEFSLLEIMQDSVLFKYFI